jgi:diguanylate cyclase (GGDEF)-like protein
LLNGCEEWSATVKVSPVVSILQLMESPTKSTMHRLPRRYPHALLVLVTTFLMVRSLFLPADLGPILDTAVDAWLYNGAQLFAGVLIVVFGRRIYEERLAWTVFGSAILVWASGNVWWQLFMSNEQVIVPPSIPDALWMLSYPIAAVGLVLLLRVRLGRQLPRTGILDALLAGTAACAFVAATAVEFVAREAKGTSRQVFFDVVYPILDLMFIGLMAGVAAAFGWRMVRSLLPLLCGVTLFAVADTAYYVRVVEEVTDQRGWDSLWLVALTVLSFSPLTKRAILRVSDLRFGAVVPASGSIVAIAVLAFGNVYPIGLFAVAMSIVTLSIGSIRMNHSLRQHHQIMLAHRSEANSDPLTALGNRRQLIEDLETRSIERRTGALVMIDLDDFKAFNDSYGHLAGDALLVQFAQRLRSHCGHNDRAYRLGGDEFCVVLDGAFACERPVVELFDAVTSAAESESISFSYGCVLLSADGSTFHDAVATADERLYEHKRLRKQILGATGTYSTASLAPVA